MAIFKNSCDDALRACIEMQEEIRKFNRDRKQLNELGPIRVGMGMHTGSLVMGIIGDENRSDAATISDTVNTASRLESLTKKFGADIILSGKSLARIENKEGFNFRYLGKSMVKGRTAELTIYECIDGDPEELRQTKKSSIPDFEKAVELYAKGEKEASKAAFLELENGVTDAVVAQFLLRL